MANDTMVTLGAGGLVPKKSYDISIESEYLRISIHDILIIYTLRNTTSRDIDAVVAFPLPEIDGRMIRNEPVFLPNDRDKINFVNFKVMDGGKRIPVKTEIRAFHEGTDVTNLIKSLGLSGTVLLEHLNAELKKLSPASIEKLKTQGLILPAEINAPEEKGWQANWTMQAHFFWHQHFPAEKTIKLTQTYNPIVGGGYLHKNDDGASNIKSFCGNNAALNQIQILKNIDLSKELILYEKNIRYILTTAQNWKGAIGNFRLSIQADDPEDIVLTCFPDLKKVAPTIYEANLKDFVPSQDLNILILQKSP